MANDGKPLLSYHIWMSLPKAARIKLAVLFSVPRTGDVIIRTGVMSNGLIGGEEQADGHTAVDLYAVSNEKMQELLGTDSTDFYQNFQNIIQNLDALAAGTFLKVNHEEEVGGHQSWPSFLAEQRKEGKTAAEASAAWKKLKNKE